MTPSFKKIVLPIILLTSTICSPIQKTSHNSKLAYKLVDTLEKKHTALRSKKLSHQELHQELTFLQSTVFYLSTCISATDTSMKKSIYIAAGSSLITLYSGFKMIESVTKNGLPLSSTTKTFDNLMFSVHALSSLTTLAVAFVFMKNYYIIEKIKHDLTKEDKEKITLSLTALNKKISFDLERLHNQ